jgi:hypothetical protein
MGHPQTTLESLFIAAVSDHGNSQSDGAPKGEKRG